MGKPVDPRGGEDNAPIALREALEERYLAYALSTIMHRALPDARDGLKPVHRRILYGMHLLRLDPAAAFKKSAKIVGDVMGTFHPHGDQAIYDALVRLAQDFASRYPLVDGQGNFGNIDGDSAAAYRYTEARMTEVARLLLQGIDEDAVPFRPNYDGLNEEPVVLPGAFPNLLANGAQGIAVGMATSIPPHNAAELCAAAIQLIDDPGASLEALMAHVPGPDFPTGGLIVEAPASLAETYRTGRGAVRLRARWHREETGRGTYVVVVTEIPYLVQKGRLIEKIAELLNEKKLPLLADIRDESAEDIRIVLEPRARNVEPELLMEALFKLTELETRFPVNMNVLIDGKVPKVVGLQEALRAFLDHRRAVLVNRSRWRLAKIEARLEILGGLLVAFLNLDEVIRIIREEDEPKPVLMARFALSEVQANAILDTRLRQLRRLEEMELRREHEDLSAEKSQIEALLASDPKQWKAVRWEIGEVAKTFAKETPLGRRRSDFGRVTDVAIDVAEALIEREPITVVVTEKGWIRALKGHNVDLAALQFKGDDALAFAFPTETTARIILLATDGKAFTLDAAKLPGGRGFGEPIRLMVDLDAEAGIIAAFPFVPGQKRLIAAKDARGFVVAAEDLLATTRKGRQVLNVDDARAWIAAPVEGDMVAIVGENRKLLVFPLSEVPEMPRGKGVRLQRYKEGGVADIKTFAAQSGLTWQDSAGRTFTLRGEEMRDWLGHRAEAGRLPPKGFPRSNRFTG
ncbi:DNA topoisomerase IV subunit A [Rhabdaerophilum calidifontis]|uniref:DNA topoisomerase IV subunit A n=1 Tax=Rhabdaerophilum calidifontis TaxID=2604328 RepID=UPI00123897F7|nr:DNA topoisomerase IV subunit A [Rhabdaerophilum calidifontis]